MKRLILSTSEATNETSCVNYAPSDSYFTYGFGGQTGPFNGVMFLPGNGTDKGKIGVWVNGTYRGFDSPE